MIDFHCHQENHKATHSIVNYSPGDSIEAPYFSIGIHPWDIDKKTINDLKAQLELHLTNKGFIALGEIGLDKLKGPKLTEQIKIFELQLKLAQVYRINTIIIHCVKAHNESVQTIKKSGYIGRIILHNFIGSQQIYHSYEKYWITYISVNLNFLNTQKNHNLIKYLGENNLLLETDDEDMINLEKSYNSLSKILNINKILIESSHSKTFYSLLNT